MIMSIWFKIIGGTRKNWAVPGYAHAPFSLKIFNGLLFGWTLWSLNVLAKFEMSSFSRSWELYPFLRKYWLEFWVGCKPPILGRGGCRGSLTVPFERVKVNSYNCFSIFSCFRDIAAFVLQNAIFPTPPLLSPEFLHVPLVVGGCPLGYEERRG